MHRSRIVQASMRWIVSAAVTGLLAREAASLEPRPLPDYPSEVDLLVDTPGSSSSVAAGLFNPAAWSVAGHPGLFLGWDDVAGGGHNDNFTGLLSLQGLGFAMRRFDLRDPRGGKLHVDDYTIGLSGGTRTGGMGLSYSWGRGDLDFLPRHKRLALGHLSRLRQASLGLASVWDLERRDNFLQADLGLRPLGPRFTLFADAVYEHGERFEDIRTGYGIEAHLVPGLTLAAKARSTGEVSLRLDVGITSHLQAGVRPHLNDSGKRLASTYTLETGPDFPNLIDLVHPQGNSYPEMHLKGGIRYQRYRWFDTRRTLLGTLQAISAVADNPRAGGIVVNLSGLSASPEMIWEVREQLAGLRARGKKVIVYIDTTSMLQYMLASVADQIWIDPQGSLELLGVNAGRTFYRNALDKMGLGIEEWRLFTYKSALESYTRTSMSHPDREQRQALVDDIYAAVARAVTSGRGMTRSRFDELVDEKAVFLPAEARAAGLVDSVGSFDQAKKAAEKAARHVPNDPEATALAGLTGDPVWGPHEWGEPPHIAVLYAIGECAMDTGIRGRMLSKAIQQAREDRNVKAVVLRADSPGGDPLPSDLVARELRETSKVKPVIVSQGQVAASGGYWISMYGDTIVASPLTITGSIGVIAGWVWNKGLGEKVGLTYDNVKHGAHADLGQGIRLPILDTVVPERPVTSEERARANELILVTYKDFVAQVAKGRELRPTYVDSIGQGRVWSGTRGHERGLVDEIGGLWMSLQLAKSAAHIPASRPVELQDGPPIGNIDFSGLRPRWIGADTPDSDTRAQALLSQQPQLSPDERTYLQHLIRAGGRPIFMIEPIEINDGSRQP